MEGKKIGMKFIGREVVLSSGHRGLLLQRNSIWLDKDKGIFGINYYCKPCREWHHLEVSMYGKKLNKIRAYKT